MIIRAIGGARKPTYYVTHYVVQVACTMRQSWRKINRMTLDQIKARLRNAHIPDVHKQTGIPKRTLYRIASETGSVPKYSTVLILQRWARRKSA